MRILFINSVCGIRSTGRICTDLADEFENQGHKVKIAYGREHVPEKYQKYAVRIGTEFDVRIHGIQSRIFDGSGFGSKSATKKFLKWADEYDPDLLWLHNLHGYYINVEFLFNWIKSRPNMLVKWTLHDCWSFTGHCSYFTMAGCKKWKTQCAKCMLKKDYPKSYLLDRSQKNYEKKKLLFNDVKNMELITPSKWLADLVSESFLKNYSVRVVYNTINKNIFKPTPGDFRDKYSIKNKRIILGVASFWTKRKGLDDFIELSKMLDDNYVIVLVGLDRKQIKTLPKKVIGITKTNSPENHVAIYTTTDKYCNPSHEKTFEIAALKTNLDGTKSIVYKGTACEEEVVKTFGGISVKPGVKNIYKAITGIEYKTEICVEVARVHKIICIPRVNNPSELAHIYTTADYFVNPTYEDNYPTVNLEAKACGTPIITYDVGGAAETLKM